jgi:hypothetical protein
VVDASRKYHRDLSLALAGACRAAGYKGYPAVAMTMDHVKHDEPAPEVRERGGGFSGHVPAGLAAAVDRRHASRFSAGSLAPRWAGHVATSRWFMRVDRFGLDLNWYSYFPSVAPALCSLLVGVPLRAHMSERDDSAIQWARRRRR